MPHKCHIYAKSSYIYNTTMCVYPWYDHAIPHWKCVLCCCADCLRINLPDQETDKQYSETSPSIRFHIYHIIARCTYNIIIQAHPHPNLSPQEN